MITPFFYFEIKLTYTSSWFNEINGMSKTIIKSKMMFNCDFNNNVVFTKSNIIGLVNIIICLWRARHETPVLASPLRIIHVDEELLVLDKPCSLPVSQRWDRLILCQALVRLNLLFLNSMNLLAKLILINLNPFHYFLYRF